MHKITISAQVHSRRVDETATWACNLDGATCIDRHSIMHVPPGELNGPRSTARILTYPVSTKGAPGGVHMAPDNWVQMRLASLRMSSTCCQGLSGRDC